ncbi:response regulator [Jannaschia formosa]|uniref:response regulator n=1 Tax=Jannaschia formosa TaxID=2259592 RepID=UPI000E1BDE09|nr:response regulator [Jannaschia formosa]TFL16837.1 response regulator [Jannaschia formosa]
MKIDRLRILAVEDEAMIAFELQDMLEDLGHEVLGPVANVDAALRLLGQSDPDAAIVDANLGGRSALPIVEALRAAGIPFALASGYASAELRQFGEVRPFIKKPYGPWDLERALKAIQGRNPSPRPT